MFVCSGGAVGTQFWHNFRYTSGGRSCHTAVLDSRWRRFNFGSGNTTL